MLATLHQESNVSYEERHTQLIKAAQELKDLLSGIAKDVNRLSSTLIGEADKIKLNMADEVEGRTQRTVRRVKYDEQPTPVDKPPSKLERQPRRIEKGRHCRICGKPGHNARNPVFHPGGK